MLLLHSMQLLFVLTSCLFDAACPTVSRRVLLESMCCDEKHDMYSLGESPPFCTAFYDRTGLLAIGHEDGIISLISTIFVSLTSSTDVTPTMTVTDKYECSPW